jgi:dTDP-glucose 4,6-dehydratase
MKTALITGGAGFIGSNFVRFLLNQDANIQVFNLDLLTYAGSLENLKNLPGADRHHFIQGDVCDRVLLNDLFEEHHFDLVVHFAAETHVDRSILGPEEFIRTNIQGTFVLLEIVRSYWKRDGDGLMPGHRFHHISTDEVYGSLAPHEPAFSETTPMAPNSPYAASKAASEHLVRAYFHTYGLPISITNCSNNYGPNQFPEKLIPLIILNALRGSPLPIYGDGRQIRDWLFVEDHCQAIWTVITKAQPGATYNVGGNNQPTNLEIVTQICQILDDLVPHSPYIPHHNLIQYVKDRPGHDRRYAMDTDRIHRDLGWEPQVSLEQGLRMTVSWYLDNSDWVETISAKSTYQNWLQNNYLERESK